MRIKSNLSGYFAASAALFARQAKALEVACSADPSDAARMEHTCHCIGAVISAASFLEVSINELYLEAIDRNQYTFGAAEPHLPELMEHLWDDLEQQSVLAKYQVALSLARRRPFDRGASPYQETHAVVQLRNALIHYKPEWNDELREHTRLEAMLRHRFPESAFAIPSQDYFPHRCLGHGCAKWAAQTSVGFYRDFMDRMGLPYRDIGNPAGLATE